MKTMKWKAWLVYDREGARRNARYIRMHEETGRQMGIAFRLMLDEHMPDFSCLTDGERPDFAIVRTIQPALTKKLEDAGIPVFNNSFVSEICNHKGKTIDYVRSHSEISVIPTRTFSNGELSEDLLSKYPKHIIKAVDGHGGKQVFRTTDSWEQISEAVGTSDFVIQPFIKGPGKDLRIYVIGKQIVGAVERQAEQDFRANFSLGGSVRSFTCGEKEANLAHTICSLFSFGLAGIDFIMDEKGEWIFNEIEDVVGARMLYQCQPEIHLLEQYFSFILENILQ